MTNEDMQVAGIVTEHRKVPTFRKHLDEAGLKYTESAGPFAGTTLISVRCKSAIGIKPIIEAANRECRH